MPSCSARGFHESGSRSRCRSPAPSVSWRSRGYAHGIPTPRRTSSGCGWRCGSTGETPAFDSLASSPTTRSDDAVLDAIDVALAAAHAIERVGGAYFVGGSLASSLQGEPRATNDVDIVVDVPLGRIRDLPAAFGADFEVDIDVLRATFLHGGCCNIFFLPLLTKVDLFPVGPTPFDEVEFARRAAVEVRPSGETLVLKTPEDTVLRKLLWFREGGSLIRV